MFLGTLIVLSELLGSVLKEVQGKARPRQDNQTGSPKLYSNCFTPHVAYKVHLSEYKYYKFSGFKWAGIS